MARTPSRSLTRKLRTLERSARVALTATSLTETSYTTRRGGMPREVRPVLRTRGERYASKDVEGRILTARCQACHRGSVAGAVEGTNLLRGQQTLDGFQELIR